MKAQLKSIETKQELDSKIKKYGRIRNTSFALVIVGAISGFGALGYNILSTIDSPEIYTDAQTTLQKLGNKRKSLESELSGLSYQNPVVKEAIGLFRYSEKMSKLDRAIQSVKEDISEIKKTPEFMQYLQKINQKTKNFQIGYFGGICSMLLGGFGGNYFSSKKRKFMLQRRKLEKNN